MRKAMMQEENASVELENSEGKMGMMGLRRRCLPIPRRCSF